MNDNYYQILDLENRISLLQGRTGRDNANIVNKLKRRLRMLKNA